MTGTQHPANGDVPAASSWISDASCRGAGADLFYSDDREEQALASAMCQGCIVRSICLETAMQMREQYGIWGGLTPARRQHLRAERKSLRDEVLPPAAAG